MDPQPLLKEVKPMTEKQVIQELLECLKWYVEEDDVSFDIPENQYWIDGHKAALQTIAKAEKALKD